MPNWLRDVAASLPETGISVPQLDWLKALINQGLETSGISGLVSTLPSYDRKGLEAAAMNALEQSLMAHRFSNMFHLNTPDGRQLFAFYPIGKDQESIDPDLLGLSSFLTALTPGTASRLPIAGRENWFAYLDPTTKTQFLIHPLRTTPQETDAILQARDRAREAVEAVLNTPTDPLDRLFKSVSGAIEKAVEKAIVNQTNPAYPLVKNLSKDRTVASQN